MILCSIPFQLCQELWFALHEPKKANPANVSNEGCVNQQQDLVLSLFLFFSFLFFSFLSFFLSFSFSFSFLFSPP